MAIFTPIVAVTVTGASCYFLVKFYMKKCALRLLSDPSLLLWRDHKTYARKKLTKLLTVEDWGDIYKRLKKNKISGGKKFINVLYMSPQRAACYEIIFNTKRLQWERNNQVLPEGFYTFVLTKNLKMLACNDKDENSFNELIKRKNLTKVFLKHTSLTRGEKVFFAGIFKLDQGRFIWNGQSGHYRPQAKHVSLCNTWLANHGVVESSYIQSEKEKIRNKC